MTLSEHVKLRNEVRMAANREICLRAGNIRRDRDGYRGIILAVYAEFGLKHPYVGNER